MFRKVCISLVLSLLLGSLGLAAQDRRPAVVMLATPSLSEHMMRTSTDQDRATGRMRARLFTTEAETYRAGLRSEKAALGARIAAHGVPIEGQTETISNAFMVQATEEELSWLRQQPGVQMAGFVPVYHMRLDKALPLIGVPQVWAALPGGESSAGQGIKIAMVDSGIDNTNPMFNDAGFTAPSGFPIVGASADRPFTNNKIIAARNFSSETTVADNAGHGTFTSSVAAGRRAQGPLASVAGVAPAAFLGNYKVFSGTGNANGTKVLQAFDAAVADGFDVINFSGGGTEPSDDAISAQHINNAVNAGVVVVISAGNDGPAYRTVTSPATVDAAIAVGASSNSRTFIQAVRVTAPTPVPAALQALYAYPGSAPAFTSDIGPAAIVDATTLGDVMGCSAFAGGSLNGKIALIKRGNCPFTNKVNNAALAGAVSAVVYNNAAGFVLMDTTGAAIPSVSISDEEGAALLSFVQANAATVKVSIDAKVSAQPVTPDQVTDFSARGPSLAFLIKPDLVAPGQDIYAGTQSTNSSGEVYDPSGFTLSQGTSFSAPMVTGAVALIKQQRASLKPAQIKSVLVNTATQITSTIDGARISVMNSGAGKMNVAAAIAARLASAPVSLSFGLQQPTATINQRSSVTLTNLGSSSESWSVTVVPRYGDPALKVTSDQSSVTIAAGASAPLTVSVSNTSALQNTYEGFVSLRSQTDGQTINIPYWVSFANPSVNANGVVNGASFTSTVAPGAIISIFGVALASGTPASAAAVPLPTSLGGATITMVGKTLPLFFSSAQQINAQLPSTLASGTVSGTLTRDGFPSGTFFVTVADTAPGLFSTTQDGKGPGAILNATSGAAISAANPAKAGSFVSVFCSGLGRVSNAPADGAAATSSPLASTLQQPTVNIGGQNATVSFSGLAPGFVALYQVNVQVPSGLAPGSYPLVLTIGAATSNTVTINVN